MLKRNIAHVPNFPAEVVVERPRASFPFEHEIAILKKRWRLIGAIIVAAGLAGLAVTLFNPPTFAGRVQFEVDYRAMQMRQQDTVYLESAVNDAIVESQVEILKSEPIASAVITQLNLTTDPEFVPQGLSIRDHLAKVPFLAFLSRDHLAHPQRTAVQSFKEALAVHRIGMSHIIEARFLSVNAEKAARIANALADAYLERQSRQRTIAAGPATAWLRKQAEQAGVRSTVLTRAETPFYPSGVGNKITIGAFLLVGACLGSGLALVLEATRQRIRSRKDISESLSLPTFGTLPRVSGSKRVDWLLDVPLHRRNRAFSHVMQHCRLACISSDPLRTVRTVAVTSAARRSGKTIVAANLAAAFSQAGGRVLLINASDPDSAKARQVDLISAPKLTDIVEERVPLKRITREVDGFFYLSMSDLAQDDGGPIEMIWTSKMGLLLNVASAEFEVVVLDLPPIAPYADVRASAAFVDAFLLVIGQGEKSERLREVLEEFDDLDDKLVGAVLNNGVRL
jgi:polysaccharide biosynthesis transport protein